MAHRPRGRAYSPPTYAWYEQLNPEDLESDRSYSDSESEDERDSDAGSDHDEHGGEDLAMDQDSPTSPTDASSPTTLAVPVPVAVPQNGEQHTAQDDETRLTSEMKGKHRAVEPPPALSVAGADSDERSGSDSPSPRKPRHHRRKQPSLSNARPILTIKSSQGFVWNQDLFVPSYVKDRYFVSTSPPSASHIMPMLASSADTLNDYEIDVVEIRVTGNELKGIIS